MNLERDPDIIILLTEAFPNTKSIVNSEHHPCHSESFVIPQLKENVRTISPEKSLNICMMLSLIKSFS